MSLVILVANSKTAYLCGDKRMTSVNLTNVSGTVYSEGISKVFKLNNEIMLGIVGNVLFCEEFFKPIMLNNHVNKWNSEITYSQMITFLDSRFEHFIDDIKWSNKGVADEHLSFAGVIIGKENGKIQGVTYGYPLLNNKPQKHDFKDEKIKLLTYGDNRHEVEFIEEYKKSKLIGKSRISESFSNTLKRGSIYDKSINTQFDIAEIEV